MLLALMKKWLKNKLNLEIDLNSEYFQKAIKDGTIMAKILERYKIITRDDLLLLEETVDPRVAHKNFLLIKGWLNNINMNLSENDIYELIHEESTIGLTLFYELFEALENKKGCVIPVKQKGKHNFTVESQSEHELNAFDFEEHSLCKPLIRKWDVLNWERDHLEAVLSKYNKSRDEYYNYLEQKKVGKQVPINVDKTKIQESKLHLESMASNYTYEELILQQKAAIEMQPFEPNLNQASKILKQIKIRNKKKAKQTAACLQSQHNLLSEVSIKIDQEEETELDKIVCNDLLKQSLHEKEIAEKLMNISQQKNIMIKNAKIQSEIVQKKKEEKFIRQLLEESTEDRLKFHQERMRKLIEHKTFYDEKLRLKALKHQKLCQEVVNDLVDIALVSSRYKSQYLVEPNHYEKTDWKHLFLKQQSILNVAPSAEEIGKSAYAQTHQHKFLVEQDFEDYIHFKDAWTIQDSLEEFLPLIKFGMNCLGYAVHRVLLKHYPLPLPQKPLFNRSFDIMVCINNIEVLSQLTSLERLLDFKSVKLITINNVINFCIDSFNDESKTEYDDLFPDDPNLKEIVPNIKHKDNIKKDKQKTKKSKESQKITTVESKKVKNKKRKLSQKTKEAKPPHEAKSSYVTALEEQTQTPKIFPGEKISLTKRGILGKIAKSDLVSGIPISDQIFAEMFVEYLLSLSDYKGWVLVNFPTTYEQAVLFEQSLTGKKAPSNYLENVVNKDSLSSLDVQENDKPNIKVQDTVNRLENLSAIFDISDIQETNKYNNSHNVTLVETDSTNPALSTSIQTSQITSLTLSDLPITSKERAINLLPDLVELAYANVSLDILKKENNEKSTNTDNDKKTCDCTIEKEKNQIKPIRCYENLPKNQEEKIIQTEIISPGDKIIDENGRPIEKAVVEDIYKKMRISKIIPNPRPLEEEIYSTPLTAYIKLELKPQTDDSNCAFLQFNKFDKLNGLEKFYCDQGCFYLLQYKDFNTETIKCLAKMIIGDYSLPLKNSIEIFGEGYKEIIHEEGENKIVKKAKNANTKLKNKSQKLKNKFATPENKELITIQSKKADKKLFKTKRNKQDLRNNVRDTPRNLEDKMTQMPCEENIEEEEIVETRPGETNWSYINLAIPEPIGHFLAELWVNFEKNYIENLKDLFSNKRLISKDIVTYLAVIKEDMFKFIVRHDQKQLYLREFQKTLNEISLDLREDVETKSQLYCQIEEFQDKLMSICESKMMESEEKRCNIIRQNWFLTKLCEMSNNIVLNLQLEIDRFVDTLQFISNYYTSIIKKSIENYKFHKQILPKIDIDNIDDNDFNALLIDIDKMNENNSLFYQFINNTINICLHFIHNGELFANKTISELKKLQAASKKPLEKKSKKKIELSDDVKEIWSRIFEEWESAVKGELARINVQLDIIKNESFARFDNIISWIKNGFEQIYEAIKKRYKNETISVQKACELLTRSVAEELIIQPALSFENDHLASIEVAIFTKKEFKKENNYFTYQQIDYMISILLDIAKSGFILKKPFLLFLQDVFYQDFLEPVLWRNKSIENLNLLLNNIISDKEYLYWKDFIVWMLLIPFPTREQLMYLRIQMKTMDLELTENVFWEDFQKITFWFEEEEDLDCKTIKSLIFKLYQINENEMNYSAMLLDFCKDENSILGFVKALELSLGKYICYDKIKGQAFVDDILKERKLYEQHEETIKLAKKAASLIVDQLLDKEDFEGVWLTEVDQNTSSSNINQPKSPKYEEIQTNPFFSDQKFQSSQIGFEVRDDTAMAYFLPLELILIVIKATVPWHLKVEDFTEECFEDKVIKVYNECRNTNFNNAVLAHEFLNYEKTQQLFSSIKKFSAENPLKFVKNIIYDFSNKAINKYVEK